MPHGKFWVDAEGVFAAAEVRKAIQTVATKDPLLHRILDRYITTKNARSQIADAELYDASTIKRKLDDALDLVLQNLKMMRRPFPEELTKVIPQVPAKPLIVQKVEADIANAVNDLERAE